MSSPTVVEHATLSDELLQELAVLLSHSFANNKEQSGPGKHLVSYEEDKELWHASMASIIAAARLDGRVFTADGNNSVMLLYMPGKSYLGTEAQNHTPEHKRLIELAQTRYPEHAPWIISDFGATLDVLERKAWPGTSHADSVHVHYLGTRVGHQGKGSGRALLQVAKTIADDKQAACAIEATLPVNVAIYERNGFKVLRSEPVHVAPKPEHNFTVSLLGREAPKA